MHNRTDIQDRTIIPDWTLPDQFTGAGAISSCNVPRSCIFSRPEKSIDFDSDLRPNFDVEVQNSKCLSARLLITSSLLNGIPSEPIENTITWYDVIDGLDVDDR